MADAGTELCLFLTNEVLLQGREGDIADLVVVRNDGRTTSGQLAGVGLGATSTLKLSSGPVPAAEIVHARVAMTDNSGRVFGKSFADTKAFLEQTLAAAKPDSAEALEIDLSLAALARAFGDPSTATRHTRRALRTATILGDERRGDLASALGEAL